MTESPHIRTEREGEIAVVIFDRPEKRNAFNLAMWQALTATMRRLSADESLRCVVLRGAGSEAFSAGADISAFEAERGTREKEDRYARILHESMQSIRDCIHPTVAMIRGICLGGGAGIATMCDFRVGGEGMRFGITACNLGIWYPTPSSTQWCSSPARRWRRRCSSRGGSSTAARPTRRASCPASCRTSGSRRRRWRSRVGSPKARLSARFHKRAIIALRGLLPITPEQEAAVNDFVLTEDFQNAFRAFLAKRKPVFRGR